MNSIVLSKTNQLLLGLLTAAISFLVLAGGAHAATFTVNTTDDGNDANPGDGICEVNIGSGDCGIRALIEETNALGGSDVGNFSIPGAGVHTFTPGSAYPNITEALTVDASTQPSASCGTLVPSSLPAASNTPHALLVDIDGSGVGNLLTISADNIVLRGLVLRSATGYGIYSSPAGTVTGTIIECNYIGTDPAGSSPNGNYQGIYLGENNNYSIQNNLISSNTNLGVQTNNSNGSFSDNLVGTSASGTSALANGSNGTDFGYISGVSTFNHNVFSGNTGDGFRITNSGFNTTITANYAGLGINGSVVGNDGDGLVVYGTSNFTVGGTSDSQRNISSGNGGAGLHIYNDCSGYGSVNSTIFNNYLGSNTSGSLQSGYGNGMGLEVNEYYGGCVSVYRQQIGGDSPGEPNTIIGNTGDGIQVHQAVSNDVFSIVLIGNVIYGNGNLGINLAFDSDFNSGVADTDLGPNPLNTNPIAYPTGGLANNYLNYPTLNSVSSTGNQLTVNYNFQANPVANNFWDLLTSNLVGYRLDFYLNDAGQDGAYAGYSQGKTHIGSFVVNGSETNATHIFTSPVTPTAGQVVTATATVLWQIIGICDGTQQGEGPPYSYCGPT